VMRCAIISQRQSVTSSGAFARHVWPITCAAATVSATRLSTPVAFMAKPWRSDASKMGRKEEHAEPSVDSFILPGRRLFPVGRMSRVREARRFTACGDSDTYVYFKAKYCTYGTVCSNSTHIAWETRAHREWRAWHSSSMPPRHVRGESFVAQSSLVASYGQRSEWTCKRWDGCRCTDSSFS
jgi:hypothetical protein